MADNFTASFSENAEAFFALHQGLKKRGFVTDAEPPFLGRPVHNSLTEERYRNVFEAHFPSQYTSVRASACAFDVGNGFPDFYVIYDSAQFEDRDEVKEELKRLGIL